jgi:hypothetical protein
MYKKIWAPSYTALALCLASAVLVSGCQKAKMTVIPRTAAPGPGITEPRPQVDPPEEEVVTPPPTSPPIVVRPPSVSPGEVHDKDPEPTPLPPQETIVIRPPVIVPPVPTFHVTQQPELPNTNRNVIQFLDPNRPYHPSALDKCAWESCRETEKPTPPPVQRREAKPFEQRLAPITHKLDVLFVVDTSNSLDDERAAIANNMHRFTAEIAKISERVGYDKQIDFQMGVLLAHGPRSPLTTAFNESVHGNLFAHPNESSSRGKTLTSDLSISQIQTSLLERFNGAGNIKSVRDTSTAQGEAGLLSLQSFVERHLSEKNGSFPRSDAALMVVFIADENDICYDYKAHNEEFARQGLDRVDVPQVHSSNKTDIDGILRDRPEADAFVNDCGSGAEGHPEFIARLLRQLKGHSDEVHDNLPIVATGVLYRTKDDQKKAQAKKESYFGDNEMGHGYLNLIREMNGVATSLLSDDFGQQLANLGKTTLFRLNYVDQIPVLKANGDFEDMRTVDVSSIQVIVEIRSGDRRGETVRLIEGQDYTVVTAADVATNTLRGYIALDSSTETKLNWTNAIVRISYF